MYPVNATISADGWVEQILKALSDLYSSAHHLPDIEISEGAFDEELYDVNNNEWKVIFDRVASIFGTAGRVGSES